MKQAIAFSNGDAWLQLVYFYCFRMDAVDAVTGEAPVWAFNQDEPHDFAAPPGTREAPLTFDAHVARVVNEKIAEFVRDLEQPVY
jgi:hypothetical protein